MKCKVCNDPAVIEKGWLNIAAMMFPLCETHMREYQEFKEEIYNK